MPQNRAMMEQPLQGLPQTCLPYGRQSISAKDMEAVLRVLQSDWLTTGPEVSQFEKELAAHCGARFAVACANGTAALHLACLALRLGPGDTILTAPITFLATANAARFVGAEVRFSDVTPDTVTLDPHQLRHYIQRGEAPRMAAIFPVHFAGHPADMEAIAADAREAGIPVVEDACHALGASYMTSGGETVQVGSCRHSAMTVFSFHPVKPITMGEGGAITTNDEHLYHHLKRLRNHGMTSNQDEMVQREMAVDQNHEANPWYYEMQELGYNYRVTDLQCALGRSQLERLPAFSARRREIAAAYAHALQNTFGDVVVPLRVAAGVAHAYHLFPVRIDFEVTSKTRARIMQELRQRGVGTQVHYIPLHLQPYYRTRYEFKPGDFPASESYYQQCLSLPIYPGMSEADVEHVIRSLCEVLGVKP